MVECTLNVIMLTWWNVRQMSSCRLALERQNHYQKMTTFDTETSHCESDVSENNLPVPITNNLALPDIQTEKSSDSETDQPEQDVTESLSENEDL